MRIISKPRIFITLSVLGCFFLQNCATTSVGKSQTIPVTSNPPGARVSVDGKERGLAPLLLQLVRDKGHLLRIEKDGYQPFEIRITSSPSFRPAGTIEYGLLVAAGVVFGGLAGGLVGYAAGHAMASEDNVLGWAGTGCLIGAIAGPHAALALAKNSESAHKLDPKSVNITLTRIGEKAVASFLLIEAHELANIRWIRIRYSDGGAEEIIDLNRTKSTEKLKERDGGPGKGLE